MTLNSKQQVNAEIIIIGGGLAGLALGAALLHLNKQIVIIDKTATPLVINKDNRGLGLAASSKKLLQRINVWQDLAIHANPIKKIHISEKDCFGRVLLEASNFQEESFGYLIEASLLSKSLLSKITNKLIYYQPAVIMDAVLTKQSWQITINFKNELITVTSPLVIAADGTQSWLRNKLGITTISHNYKHYAMVATVQANLEANIAYERFTEQGICALLPLSNNLVKCIWSLKMPANNQLASFNDKEFLDICHWAMQKYVGKFSNPQPRQYFNLQAIWAQSIIGPRSILIGNAANTLNPIAAQGLNLGLRDISAIINILDNTDLSKLSYYETQCLLEKYAKNRATDHELIRNFTHNLHGLFTSKDKFYKFIRGLGLKTVSLIDISQYIIARLGMGIYESS